MDRMFLIEKGKFVAIRDGQKEIGFGSFEEFNLYYPALDLTGKWYVDYEPERYLWIDSTLQSPDPGVKGQWNHPPFEIIPKYEAVIDAIDDIIAKRNDIFFGKSQEEILDIKKQLMTHAVQNLLDTTAQARNYDGILSASTYATSTNAVFCSEGQACVAWRDAVWGKCYEILGAVQMGTRPIPTITELLKELPVLTWP